MDILNSTARLRCLNYSQLAQKLRLRTLPTTPRRSPSSSIPVRSRKQPPETPPQPRDPFTITARSSPAPSFNGSQKHPLEIPLLSEDPFTTTPRLSSSPSPDGFRKPAPETPPQPSDSSSTAPPTPPPNPSVPAQLTIEPKTLHSYTTTCLLYTSPSPRDGLLSRMPSSP